MLCKLYRSLTVKSHALFVSFLKGKWDLFYLLFCSLFFSFNAAALSFKTATTEPENTEYYRPNYPMVFVSAKIIEHETEQGIRGDYNLGTDVLSANNPSGGNKLWLLLPNGDIKLLFPLPVHQHQGLIDTPLGFLDSGSVVEPNLSEDGKTVYFSYFHHADEKSYQSALPQKGADLYSIKLTPVLENYQLPASALMAKRLTQGNVKGVSFAMNNILTSNSSDSWGNVFMHPEEMRTKFGLKLVYVSNKKRLSNSNKRMSYANHNFNLYIADINDDGSLSNHQQFQYYTTTSALSPNRLRDGIAFSYQASTSDARHWQIQGLTSAGKWFPIIGYGNSPEASHLSTFCVKSKGDNPGDYLVTTNYYNLNNNGFGSLHSLKLSMAGMNAYDYPQSGVIVPRQLGAKKLTKGIKIADLPSVMRSGKLFGKFTTPRCGLADELYFAHTATSANGRRHDNAGNKHYYRSYIGFRNNLEPFFSTDDSDLSQGRGIAKVIVDATGERNLLWPLPILNWQQRTGDIEQAYSAPAVAAETSITAGEPFADVGTSALYNTDRRPFDCWLGNQGQVPYSPTKAHKNVNNEWQELVGQSAGLNRVQNQKDFCEYLLPENVFGIAVNLTSNRLRGAYGNYESQKGKQRETSKLLGVYSVVDQADQSFKARIPANVPFDFHLLDRKTGLKLTDVRSWHSLQPEESRTDCGGCHQHEKAKAIPFENTYAGVSEPLDMTKETQYIDYNASCQPQIKTAQSPTIEPLEWVKDIWPGFDKHCGTCHNAVKSEDEQALLALTYSHEQEAYQQIINNAFVSHTLGALGSAAWWAARGERTDGRDNTLVKYQPNYAKGQVGFKFSDIHKTAPSLCDGSSLENAQWVYKFGRWIDNFQHRDIGTGVFNTKLDRYHPTVHSAIIEQCQGNKLNVGWWDDSGKIKQLSLKVNNISLLALNDVDNGSTFVTLNQVDDNAAILLEVEDNSGNKQNYQKSLKQLKLECQVRAEGSTTEVTAKAYSHEHDYSDAQTDIGTVLNAEAVAESNNNQGQAAPGANPETDAPYVLPADIDSPLESGQVFTRMILPIIADATISSYGDKEAKMNFGGARELKTFTGGSRKFLIKTSLDQVPKTREVIKARLKIYTINTNYITNPMLLAFKVTTPWQEGTKRWSSWPDGVTWYESNYADHQVTPLNNWLTAGGDFNNNFDYGYGNNGLIARAMVTKGEWLSLDITEVVKQWKQDPSSNHGLLIRGIMQKGNSLVFASRENTAVELRPYIEYLYQGEDVNKRWINGELVFVGNALPGDLD